jgi:hypothetical protein
VVPELEPEPLEEPEDADGAEEEAAFVEEAGAA